MKEYYKELGEYVSFYDDKNGLEATKNLDNIEDIFAYQNLIERLEEIIEENELDEEMFNNNDNFIIKLFKKTKIFIPIRGVLGLIASIIFSQVLLSNADPNLMLVSSKYLSYMFPSLFAISVGAVDFKEYCDYVKSFKVKNARKVRIETLKKELEWAKTKLEELKKESKPVDRVDLQKKEIRDDEINAAMNNVDFYGFLACFFERYSKAYENGNLDEVLKTDGYEGEFLIIARDYIINNPHNLTTTPNIRRLVRTRQR